MGKFEQKIASFVEKVGCDRLLHFLVAYSVVMTCLVYGMAFAKAPVGCAGWAALIVTGLAFIKEKFIDEKFDTVDLVASFFGAALGVLMYVPIDAWG